MAIDSTEESGGAKVRQFQIGFSAAALLRQHGGAQGKESEKCENEPRCRRNAVDTAGAPVEDREHRLRSS